MILIFGGVYQGKLEYAIGRFGLTEEDITLCADENATCPTGRKVIGDIEKWILALIKDDKNVLEETEQFINKNRDTIVICTDISCGIVPIDPIMRKWREEVGKFLGLLATNSDEVIRLYCGIPTILKQGI
ncbi:MAG: bifunctional adenosylcobinamide kinase/adenosylcobinamide-phosphate guanylyltransferase [Defluviitaleaceae bacterium]|nr:bifunctional adenosylcobinamide kinase/adenosylcobinamide-phosphate guanylyltransferase [Defluviitaleaceae bacterium]